MDQYEILKKNYNTVKTIAFQVILAIIIFGYIAHRGSQGASSNSFNFQNVEQIKLIFFIICIVLFSILKFIKNSIKNMRMTKLTKAKNLSEAQFFINKLTMSSIFGLGVCQIPALFGMILAIQSRSMNEFYMFSILSVIGLVFQWPKYSVWEEELRTKTEYQ